LSLKTAFKIRTALNERNNNLNKKYRLYNILNDELWDIQVSPENLIKIFIIIKNHKNNIDVLPSDSVFFEQINNYKISKLT